MTKPNSMRQRYQTKRYTRVSIRRWKRETIKSIDALAVLNGVSRNKQILSLLAARLGA